MTAAAIETPALTPVAAEHRLHVVDALRGFALLGILLVNFQGADGAALPRLDAAVTQGLGVLVDSSFYPLFSFLFGLGFALQLVRARESGSAVLRVYVRRLLALVLIGTVHAVLIWDGDIALDYAIMGFLLIPLYPLRNRWLIVLAAGILVAETTAYAFRPWFSQLGRAAHSTEKVELEQMAMNTQFPPPFAFAQRVRYDDNMERGEAYRATVMRNWQQFVTSVRSKMNRHVLWSDIFMCFILGLVVGRKGWLQHADRHKRGFLMAGGIAFAATVAGNVGTFVIEPEGQFWGGAQWMAANFGLTVTYICLFALAFGSWPAVARRLAIFAPIGQIGLTGYLMQSVVMTLLFRKYGLGLPEPSTTGWFVLDVAFFFAVQLTFARWWTARYRFGPAEWVWRSLTYGRLQPMRRSSEDPGVRLPPSGVPRGSPISEPVRR